MDYASYSVEAVHLGSKNPEHAWNFIHSFATSDQAAAFAEATGRVPARLSDVGQLKDDPDRGLLSWSGSESCCDRILRNGHSDSRKNCASSRYCCYRSAKSCYYLDQNSAITYESIL